MRVLVISHNVFGPTSAMGKTLTSYFERFDKSSIAQFYIHSEVPVNADICTNYFRFTDVDAIKARLPIKDYGRIFRENDIQKERVFTRTDTGLKRTFYQKGRKRTAQIYFLRNLLWKTAFWKTAKFRKWVIEFSPDVIFFASGDYAFMYDIAQYTAKLAKCPLIISCMDDFYLGKSDSTWFARKVHESFMSDVKKAMGQADLLVCMCDEMSQKYERLFHVEAHTLYTAVKSIGYEVDSNGERISYIGNIGSLRLQALKEIGDALSEIKLKKVPKYVDVYSQEKSPEIISQLRHSKGIRFHGEIPAEDVEKIMNESMLVVHVESMKSFENNPARYSISTKIPESLMKGPCLLAYGPKELASINYLSTNHAAYVITSRNELKEGLTRIVLDRNLRYKIVKNARDLAQKNHTEDGVFNHISEFLKRAVRNYDKRKGQ